MTRLATIAFIALALVVVGCGSGSAQPDGDRSHAPDADAHDADGLQEDAHASFDKMVAIARDIEAGVKSAEAVLDEHDISAERFESLIYDISADPELSRRFNEAVAAKNPG